MTLKEVVRKTRQRFVIYKAPYGYTGTDCVYGDRYSIPDRTYSVHCAIGALIPKGIDNYDAIMSFEGDYYELIDHFPDVDDLFDVPIGAMKELQQLHDAKAQREDTVAMRHEFGQDLDTFELKWG